MSGLVADNLARVRERIAVAADRAGRDASEITLIAVTKRQPIQILQEVLNAGAADMGENYVQEAQAKREALGISSENGLPRWHLIGHLQSNKAKQSVALFDLIQSVDSLKLAQALAHQSLHQEKAQAVLIQVHLGDEETKTGLAPEVALDVISEIAALPGLDVQGLMGIAPGIGDPRPHFAFLRRLFERLPPVNRRTLSMGMTGDFETAIAEGATMVRIGTAIFGPRQCMD
jgi:pyridoxal phosphate enzyme (YggS family)